MKGCIAIFFIFGILLSSCKLNYNKEAERNAKRKSSFTEVLLEEEKKNKKEDLEMQKLEEKIKNLEDALRHNF